MTETRRSRNQQMEQDPFERVLDEAFSRNRHFAWYEQQPRTVRAFRRLVRGLLADLQHAGEGSRIDVEKEPGGSRFWLSLHIPRFRVSHRCRVAERELRAMRRHPVLGEKLWFKDGAS